jgi:hypothetical protein
MQPAGPEHIPLRKIPLCSTITIEAISVSIHHQDGCAIDLEEHFGLVVIQYDLSKEVTHEFGPCHVVRH